MYQKIVATLYVINIHGQYDNVPAKFIDVIYKHTYIGTHLE